MMRPFIHQLFLWAAVLATGCAKPHQMKSQSLSESAPHQAKSPAASRMATSQSTGHIALLSPEAFKSSVDPRSVFKFGVTLGQAKKGDVEAAITITPRGSESPINGSFTWKRGDGWDWILTFTPASPLSATVSDYVVDCYGSGSFVPMKAIHVGVSVGAHPRVQRVRLVSKDGQTLTYAQIEFSEPVATDGAKAAVALRDAADSTSRITTSVASDGTLPNSTRGLRVQFNPGVYATHALVLALGTVTSTNGRALEPGGWDASTQANDGGFRLNLSSPNMSDCGAWCWEWQPEIQ